MKTPKQTLSALFFPIFSEALLVALISLADTAMASSVGDAAVGAVGSSGTYLHMVEGIMAILSVGAGSVMSRFAGAERYGAARKALNCSVLAITGIGAIFALIFLCFSAPILTAVGTNAGIYDGAVTYTRILGTSFLFLAPNYVFTVYLRAFGRAKDSMISGLIGNLGNIGLNALFLSMGMGIFGIAVASLIARAVTLLLSALFALRLKFPKENTSDVSSRRILHTTFAIGIPGAAESTLFSLCGVVAVSFINQMDTTGIAINAYSYFTQIITVFNCVVTAFAQSSAVLVGWKIGAGQSREAYRASNRACLICAGICCGINLVLLPFFAPIVSLLTDNQEILAMAVPTFLIQFIRLIGTSMTNTYGYSIKTAGDAPILLLYGIIMMPLWTVVGSWLLGIVCGFGVYGYWIGSSMDELSRGILMFLRWRSRKWEAKAR